MINTLIFGLLISASVVSFSSSALAGPFCEKVPREIYCQIQVEAKEETRSELQNAFQSVYEVCLKERISDAGYDDHGVQGSYDCQTQDGYQRAEIGKY